MPHRLAPAAAIALGLAGCFEIDVPSGRLLCATRNNRCPLSYHCSADNRCWKDGEDPGLAASDGGGDSGGDSGVGCVHALCEDFESGTLAAWWSKSQDQGSLSVEQTLVHKGSYALHLHSNAVSASTLIDVNINEHRTFPAYENGLYARAFVYLPSASVPAASAFLFQMSQRSPVEGDQLEILGPGGAMSFYQYGSSPDVSQDSGTHLPTDRWVCVEWEMLAGETHTFLDGLELTDLHKAGLAVLTFDTFYFGWDFYKSAAQPAYDVWMDDLALDGTRIGCQ
jgi:hypothetical protein